MSSIYLMDLAVFFCVATQLRFVAYGGDYYEPQQSENVIIRDYKNK